MLAWHGVLKKREGSTLSQVFKEALGDSEQGPVVVLEDGGGGHHQLCLGLHLWHLLQALSQPAPVHSLYQPDIQYMLQIAWQSQRVQARWPGSQRGLAHANVHKPQPPQQVAGTAGWWQPAESKLCADIISACVRYMTRRHEVLKGVKMNAKALNK